MFTLKLLWIIFIRFQNFVFFTFKLVMLRTASILAIFLIFSNTSLANVSAKTNEANLTLPLIGIRINAGANYTNNRTIEVEIKSLKTDPSLLESMKVGFHPELTDVSWQPYAENTITIQLPEGDGEKRVYVQLKDKAGNASPIETNKIVLDTAPPENPMMQINAGEKYTNDKMGRVLVNVKADDAHEVMISNSAQFQNGRWESYKEAIKWVIDVGAGDGEKTVYAKFRDQAGNESKTVQSAIILDVTPPSDGSIIINGGEKFTRSTKLNIQVSSSDATKVRIVCRGEGKNYDLEPGKGPMDIIWDTDSIQGVKSFKAYFMDEAKNTTRLPAESSIILKTNPPAAPVINVNQGAKFINHKDGIVSFTLSAKEKPQELKMLVSNKPNFEGASPRAFATTISNWKLEGENDGLKTIYVRLMDEAGNISDIGKYEVYLDRTPPRVNSFGINDKSEWCINMKVVLNSDVDDAHEAKFSNNPTTLRNIPWEKYNPARPDWSLLPGDGEKTVYAMFRDKAGNATEVITSKINLDMTPPNGELIINGGNKVSNHPEGLVKLQIRHDADVIGMQITNVPNFEEVKLLPLEKTIENWKIDDNSEGLKTVFLRLQDKAGNYSKVLTSTIILDRTPPSACEMVINNNDPFVRNPNKRVALSLRAEGASSMMISNNESMEGAEWVPFKTAIAWTLEGPEGIHYIHAKFKDNAGNESEVISKSVKSDFSPPKIVKFDINDGAEFTYDPQGLITLTFDVEDAKDMAISNSQLNDTSNLRTLWEPYKTTKSWNLEGEDGLKIVYGRFRDEANNITHAYYDKIVLDRIPPTDGKIIINNGASWLTNKDGKCNISVVANGASEVMLSNTADFSNAKWEPIVEIKKDWILNIQKSEAKIYAKFRDQAGNVSGAVESSVNIDLDPPKNIKISIDNDAKYVLQKDRKITISLSAEGATGMRISQYQDFKNARWEPYATTREYIFTEPDGEKTFYAQFVDDAGNQSEVTHAKIILDTTPPKINKLTIDNGEEWTNSQDKKVTLSIDAIDATEMMIGDNPDFTNASWEPFKPSIPDYILPGDDGEKVIFIRLRDEPGNISRVVSAKINLKRSF